MTPYLVTPPADSPVSAADLRAHLRLDHQDDDALIAQFQAAAVAHLDGWRGVLGRAIMPQVWAQEVEGPGPHLLAMPDASAVTAAVDGVPVDVAVTRGAAGQLVEIEADGPAVVQYSCALSAQQLPVARVLVMMMVAHWYAHREAAAGGSVQLLPLAVDSLIAALRWRRA